MIQLFMKRYTRACLKNQPVYVSESYGNIYRLLIYLSKNELKSVFTQENYCDNRQECAGFQCCLENRFCELRL